MPGESHPKFTAQQMIDALSDAKGMVSIAARRLKCHPDTVRSYVKRYPTVQAAIFEAREQTTDVAELALFKAIQGGEAWAVSLYLKTVGKERGYVERTENRVTGADGGDVIVRQYVGVDPTEV